MSGFSNSRLQGRAPEHRLSPDGGDSIRMKDKTGKFTNIRGPEAKQIRKDIQERADKVVEEMASQGLFRKGAECHVKVPDEDGEPISKSVDLRTRVAVKDTEALLEVEWTRGSLGKAENSAQKSLPWLRNAWASGRWASSGKRLRASAVGAF